jgi:hypothetical protein
MIGMSRGMLENFQVKQRGERFPQFGAIACRLPASSTV